MPTYTFLNTETGDLEDHFMSYTKLDEFKENNPTLQQRIGAPAIVGGHGDRAKNSAGFNEVMSKIGEAHPGSEVAKRYGDNRTIKQKKTIDTVTKHVVKQAKKK
jgi:hypothetical protein